VGGTLSALCALGAFAVLRVWWPASAAALAAAVVAGRLNAAAGWLASILGARGLTRSGRLSGLVASQMSFALTAGALEVLAVGFPRLGLPAEFAALLSASVVGIAGLVVHRSSAWKP
jgi:hypothetical protein